MMATLASRPSSYLPFDSVLDYDSNIKLQIEKEKVRIKSGLSKDDPKALEFLQGDYVQYESIVKPILFDIIKASVDADNSSEIVLASRAITMLNSMKVSLSSLDLQGIKIPNANLSGAILDDSNLSKAVLENVNFANASLNRTLLNSAKIQGIQLGVLRLFSTPSKICSFITSPSKEVCITRDQEKLTIWDASEESVKSIPLAMFGADIAFIDDQCIIAINDAHRLCMFNSKKIGDLKAIELSMLPLMEDSRFILSLNRKTLFIIKRVYSGPKDKTADNYAREYSIELSVWGVNYEKSKGILKCSEIQTSIPLAYQSEEIFVSFKATMYILKYFEKDKQVIKIFNRFFDKRSFKYCSTELGSVVFPEDVQIQAIFFTQNEEDLVIAISDAASKVAVYIQEKIKSKGEWNYKGIINNTNMMFREASPIKFLQLIPNSATIMYLKDDGSSYSVVCTCDCTTKEVKYCYKLLNPNTDQLKLSEDGEWLYQICGDKVYILSVGELLRQKYSTETIAALSFSKDSTQVAALLDNTFSRDTYKIQSYNASSGMSQQIKTVNKALIGEDRSNDQFDENIYYLSSCTNYLVSIMKRKQSTENYDQALHDMNAKFRKLSIGNNNEGQKFDCENIFYITQSQDSQFLAILRDHSTLEIVDTRTINQQTWQLNITDYDFNNANPILKITFSATFSSEGGYIGLASGKRIACIRLKMVDNVLIIDSENSKSISHIPDEREHESLMLLKFCAIDQRLLLVRKSSIFVWDNIKDERRQDQQSTKEFEFYPSNHANNAHLSKDISYAFDVSSDGRFLIYCHEEQSAKETQKCHVITLWDLKGNEFTQLCTKEVVPKKMLLQFSPDGKRIASCQYGGNIIYMWQLIDNEIRLLWRSQPVLEAHKLKISEDVDVSPLIKEILIRAGAEEETAQR